MSDVRARDERDQGHGSRRKLREPGILGPFLAYAADLRIPQSCVNLHHRPQNCVHVLRLQAMCMDSYGSSGMVGSCCRFYPPQLMMSYTMTWDPKRKKTAGGKLIGVPGSQPYGRLSLGHAVMSLVPVLDFGSGFGLGLIPSSEGCGVWGLFVCPPSGS